MTLADQEATKSQPPGGTLGWVGPFQLLERVPGKGDVAQFHARQHGPAGFERLCTLKLAARAPREVDRRANETIAREAKLLTRFDHPAIVRFHDFVTHDEHLILVLEDFSRLSLDRFLTLVRKQKIDLDERIVWHVGCALFGALAHAHGLVDPSGNPAPVVHRDVRPDNVLIASDGRVRLTGFGFAQDRDPDAITACGVGPAGPTYVAPELLRSGEASDRSDAFSAALIIWEMLTGRSATPEGLSEFDLLKALSERRVEPLRVLRPDLPALVTTALDICLSTDPAQRTIGCLEVEGCMRAGIQAADGAEPIRRTIVALGPSIEKIAGGPAAPPPSSRARPSNPPLGLSPRPQAVTIPGEVHLAGPVEAAVTAVPRAPVLHPVPQPDEPAQHTIFDAQPEQPTAILIREAPASQAPAPRTSEAHESSPPVPAVAPYSSAPPAPNQTADLADDLELAAWNRRRDRQRLIRRAVIAIPAALAIAGLMIAAQSNWRDDNAVVTLPATATAPKAAAQEPSPEPEPSHALPTPSTSSPPVPSDKAMLIVAGPPSGHVFVQGKAIGRTDEPILTECGQRFMRVGSESGSRGMENVAWLAEGQSVSLRCGERLRVQANPSSR